MYNLIPQLILILSLAGIIVIVGRKLPVVLKMPKKDLIETSQDKFFEKSIFEKISIRKYQIIFFKFLEKSLRRTIILSLKTANLGGRWVESVKEKSKNLSFPYIQELKRRRENGSLSRKEAEYIEAIKSNPQDVEIYKRLGNLYLRNSNFRDARFSYEEVLKINPEDEEAKRKLEEIRGRVLEA